MGRGKGDSPIFKITRKNASGQSYQIYAYDFTYDDGTKKRFYGSRAETKADLNARRIEMLASKNRQTLVKPSIINIEKFLTDWLRNKRDISKTTKTTYTNYLKAYIFPIISDIKLQDVKVEHMDSLINHLYKFGGKRRDGLAPSTLKKIKFMLSQAFDMAIEREIIIKNPMKHILLPKISKPKNKTLSTEEIKKLLNVSKELDLPMYYGILLAVSTGLRRGELLALRWSDINRLGVATIQRQLVPVSGGVEILENLKTDKSVRQIQISSKVLAELRQKKAVDFSADLIDNDLIICQSNGKHFHPRNFAQKFDKLLKLAGLEHRKIHDLRHTFATQLLTDGAYVSEVQAALGHTDAKTTLNNYAHVLPGRQKELAKRMDSILPI